jgi:hypothetical protein
VAIIPEACPDNCTGIDHGKCVNSTSAEGTKAKDSNSANYKSNGTFCICLGSYSGINCGQYPPDDIVALVAGISTAAIAGIIVGIVLVLGCVGGGSAYAYTQVYSNEQGMVVENNPIYSDPNQSGVNPIHRDTAT